MKIIYCHHAQRDNHKSQNDDLTDLGRRDACLVAELLANAPKINAIYTSNFYRCKETAKLINSQINVPIYEDTRLNEFKSAGEESWIDLQNRIISVLKEIIDKHNNSDIVVCVTSGINIAGFIDLAYNIEPSENVPFIGVSSCSPLIFNFEKH